MDGLFGVVHCGMHVAAWSSVSAALPPPSPWDVLLLLNLISAARVRPGGEALAPACLPDFNADASLQTYVRCFSPANVRSIEEATRKLDKAVWKSGDMLEGSKVHDTAPVPDGTLAPGAQARSERAPGPEVSVAIVVAGQPEWDALSRAGRALERTLDRSGCLAALRAAAACVAEEFAPGAGWDDAPKLDPKLVAPPRWPASVLRSRALQPLPGPPAPVGGGPAAALNLRRLPKAVGGGEPGNAPLHYWLYKHSATTQYVSSLLAPPVSIHAQVRTEKKKDTRKKEEKGERPKDGET